MSVHPPRGKVLVPVLMLGSLFCVAACQNGIPGGVTGVTGPDSRADSPATDSPATDSPATDSQATDSSTTPPGTGGPSPDESGPATADVAANEPAEVELSNPRARIDERGIFWFGVKYRFAKGAPRKYYLLTVKFPGTQNLCLKHMEVWQLKSEGEIRDGIPLIEQPVLTYEIEFSEADSPMNEYKVISNTLTVTMTPPKPAGDAESEKAK
jgi:hypothetical protein